MLEEDKKTKIPFQDIMRFAWYYWRPHKYKGAAAIALLLLSVAMDAIVPVYTGRMIDAMAQDGSGDSAAWAAVISAFTAFAALNLLQVVFRQSSMAFWNVFAVHNLYGVVRDGLFKVQRFSTDWHANSFAGGTVRKITRGMWALDSFEDTMLMGILPAVSIMIFVMITLSMTQPAIAGVASLMVLFYAGLSIWMSVAILSPRFRESSAADTKIGATLADIITGNATVKAFGTEAREDDVFTAVATQWRKKALRAWQTGVATEMARSTMRVLMVVSMVGATALLWHRGTATAGDIVMVMTTFFIINGYLRDIGMHIANIQRAIGDMEDVVGFWLRNEDVTDAMAAKTLTVSGRPATPLIRFENVDFHYGDDSRPIYQGLSVDIARGEKIALVGASGSGKSTFVKLLQRLYNVTGGRILIDGQDIAHVTLESLRRSIALVPQDPVLFHRSLAENIAYGAPDVTQDAIVAAAKKAYAHDFIERLPMGYDTLVGERGVKLSGGERQRVAIARAILADAPVLVLDEATSSLDSISEHYIQMALARLMDGKTTITIAHRLSTIQSSDRILVFDQGRIVEAGRHADLMQNTASRYKALHDMQLLGLDHAA